MSYLIDCVDRYMSENGAPKGDGRRPIVVADTSFLISGSRYDEYDDVSWGLVGDNLAFTEGLEDEYEDHNMTYVGGSKEIPDEVYNDVMRYGTPVEEFFDQDVDEYEVLGKYMDDIEEAVGNAFEEEQDVSVTDTGILAAAMEMYPRRVAILSEDKHLRETVEELRKPGYQSYNSGYDNICVSSNSDVLEMVER